jgi:hypothetical protein
VRADLVVCGCRGQGAGACGWPSGIRPETLDVAPWGCPRSSGAVSCLVRCATVGSVSDLDEFRDRLDVLETEVARLREDAAATRTLASMADRDASEVRGALRAHTQALNALRETQIEQGRTQAAHTRTLEAIAEAVGALVAGQQRHEETLSGIAATLQRLTDQS